MELGISPIVRTEDVHMPPYRRSVGKSTYADQDALVLDVDVGDGELVGKRHGCDDSSKVCSKKVKVTSGKLRGSVWS